MDSEVVFKSGAHHEDQEDHEDHEDREVHVDQEDQEKTPDSRIPPTPITQRDMDTIIRGWEGEILQNRGVPARGAAHLRAS